MHLETPYNHRYRGITLIYGLVYMTIFAILCAFAADYGRVQMAKTELQRMVDASARAAASQINRGTARVHDRAVAYAQANAVTAEQYSNLTVESGKWNTSTRTFQKLSGINQGSANAVRVTARKDVSNSWAHLLHSSLATTSVSAEAIATLRGGDADLNVTALFNPYLSGMPNGTVTLLLPPGEDPDFGDQNLVASMTGLGVYEGAVMTFPSVSGRTNNNPHAPPSGSQGPDGDVNASRMFTKWNNMPEFGISPLTAPPNSMIGVFLSDDRPDATAAPTINTRDCPSDYSRARERNRAEYRPKLKQMFFIGDGKTDDGDIQRFVAPPGATRLFIGNMDEYEWNNNWGSFDALIDSPEMIQLVK